MFKKVIAVLAVVAGVALFGALPASADQYSQVTLQPGERHCAREFYPAYSQARGYGQVLSGHNVRWVLGTHSPVQQRLVDTMTPQPSFGAEVNRYTHSYAFPGYFQVCAINQSLKVSEVVMQVSSF